MTSLICRAIDIAHSNPSCFNEKVPHFASRALLTALAPRLAERFYLRLDQFNILREFSGGSLRYTRALFLQGRSLNDSVLTEILNGYCYNLRSLRLGIAHNATNALAEVLVCHPTVRDVKLSGSSNSITAAFYVRLLDHPSEEFRRNIASLISDSCEVSRGSLTAVRALASTFREQAYDAGVCAKLCKMITPSVNDVRILGVAVLALSRVTYDNDRVTEKDVQDLIPSVELCLNCSDRTVHQQALRFLNRASEGHPEFSTFIDQNFPEIWPRVCELIRRKATTLPALWSAINLVVSIAETVPKIGAKFFYEFKIFDHIIERTNDADDKTIHEDSVVESAALLVMIWLHHQCVRKADFRRERNIFRWLMKVSIMKRRNYSTIFGHAVNVTVLLSELDSFVDTIQVEAQKTAYASVVGLASFCQPLESSRKDESDEDLMAKVRGHFESAAEAIKNNRCGVRTNEANPGDPRQLRPCRGNLFVGSLFVVMDDEPSRCNDNDNSPSTTQDEQNKEFDPYTITYEEDHFLCALVSADDSFCFPVLSAMYRAVDPESIPHLKNLAIRGQSLADFLIENNFIEFCLHVVKRWSCEELDENVKHVMAHGAKYFCNCVEAITDCQRKKDFEITFAQLAEDSDTINSRGFTNDMFRRPCSPPRHRNGECYFGDKKINEFGDVVMRFDDKNIISSGLRKIITGHRNVASLNRNSLERFRITDFKLLEILRENEMFSSKRTDFRVNGVDSLPASIKNSNHVDSWKKDTESRRKKSFFDRMVDINKSKREYFTTKRSEFIIDGGRTKTRRSVKVKSSGDDDDDDDDSDDGFNNNYSDNHQDDVKMSAGKSIEEILIQQCGTEKQFFLRAEELFRLQQQESGAILDEQQQRRRSRTTENNIAGPFLVSAEEFRVTLAGVHTDATFLNPSVAGRITSLFSLGEEDQLNLIFDAMSKHAKGQEIDDTRFDLNVFASRIRSIYAAARKNEIQKYH